jgi:hypothetical protein
MTKRAKSWCTPKCSHCIDDKFEWEDDQRRVYVPEFYMLKTDLKYLNRLAKRKKLSPSACLEMMLNHHLITGWGFLLCYKHNGEKRKISSKSTSGLKVPRRKYMIHPSMLSIVDGKREEFGVSYSVFFERLVGAHREEYPLFDPTSPPFAIRKDRYKITT